MTKLVVLLFCAIGFAQNSKKDLYIFFPESTKVALKNNSGKVELYQLILKPECDKGSYKLSMDTNGNLKKESFIKAGNATIVRLTYNNIDGKNSPKLVSKTELINTVTYDELSCLSTFEKIIALMDNFNLFLVTLGEVSGDFFIAKKITFDVLPGL
jgi:hypothetical protein